jgi:predicted RNA binding protein YcfA (HicA-like mRNA interferase family)
VLHHVRGDHHQFKHPVKSGKVTVPHLNKDMAIGTLKSTYKQAGWDWK